MRVVKAAAVQLSPVLYSRDGTVDKVVQKIHELGHRAVADAPAADVAAGGSRPHHQYPIAVAEHIATFVRTTVKTESHALST
jgi:hypothetical protein